MANRLDRLPAGGDLLTIALIAFVVLVILDAVGVTDIFPFIKSKKNVITSYSIHYTKLYEGVTDIFPFIKSKKKR